MKVLISGLAGHMGQEVARLVLGGYRGAVAFAGVDRVAPADPAIPCFASFREAPANADVIVDFSHPSVLEELLDFAVANRIPAVLATTGYTPAQRKQIADAAQMIPIFYAANYSLGVALLIELAKQTAATFPEAEIEIIEKHHDRKVDAPSGTALAIADAIREVRPDATVHAGRSGTGKRTPGEIGIHAIRMGNIVGEHEVLIGTGTQTVTLKHEAHSRALFAEGALCAAAFLIGQKPGLYNMKSMLSNQSEKELVTP